ncbi:MAG: hypothetical protein LBT46_11500 [Planctomycetaceae bacterium]|jgi:hypothetical protein|nr:hypothetical protein [Planctomycetaceae bacterium]
MLVPAKLPKTTIADNEHKKFPYLLQNITASHPNHIWSTDITYLALHQAMDFFKHRNKLFEMKINEEKVLNRR